MIFPLATVSRTCTAPYWVCAASPVNVPVAAAWAPPWAEAAGGAPTPAACAEPGSDAGFSDSSSTIPDTVAAPASTTRLMG